MKKNSYLEYEIKSKKTYKKETKEVLLTINYTDRKVNFTKLLQCRNLYLFNFERARLSRIFWDTELILKYRTWPVFVVERLIGLFKWVSRLWPNGKSSPNSSSGSIYSFHRLWNISFNILLPFYQSQWLKGF